MGIAGLVVSLAGFAGLISALESVLAHHLADLERDELDTDAPLDFFGIDRTPISMEERNVLA